MIKVKQIISVKKLFVWPSKAEEANSLKSPLNKGPDLLNANFDHECNINNQKYALKY